MYNSDEFVLFDYSDTTLLQRPTIVGWINKGFHAGLLNVSQLDEQFPGNVFRAGSLALYPSDNSVKTVVWYKTKFDGGCDVSVCFFAMNTI